MNQNKTCWALDASKISAPSGFTQSDGEPSPKAFSDAGSTTALPVTSLAAQKTLQGKKLSPLPLTPNPSRPVVRDGLTISFVLKGELLPGSWSVARKTQNNRGFVQRRGWVPPGTEKQLLMGQQDFLFLHKAIHFTVQNINLMARYGSHRAHSRVPLCSSIPRDASVCMGISWAAGWREVLVVAAKLHLLCCERRLTSLCLVIREKNKKSFVSLARGITFSPPLCGTGCGYGSFYCLWWETKFL